MKISVCGKGGSGKSAIAVMLATGMRNRGYQAVVIDADESNAGLHRMLGFENPPVPILDLVGGKQEVKNVLPKTPVAQSEPQTNVIGRDQVSLDDIPAQHILRRDGISLVSVGKILQALEGCACPMGVLSREFVRKLDLGANSVAIVDMEAGVEHFGRGVDTSTDIVLIVVDPSYESIQLAEKVRNMTAGIGIDDTWAVLNKVTSSGIASRLKEELRKRDVTAIGCVHYDPAVFEACLEGRPLQPGRASRDIAGILDLLLPDGR